MNQQILNEVVNKLQRTLEIPVQWKEIQDSEDRAFDAILEFGVDNEKFTFFAEVKREIRKPHLPQLIRQHQERNNLIVIAQYLYPQIRNVLKHLKINYADNAGNIYFRHKTVFVYQQSDQGPASLLNSSDNAFTKTGLKVILCFLLDESTLNMPYRDLAKRAVVSVGILTKVMRILKKDGFILIKDKKQYMLEDKTRLFRKWAENYLVKLKPTQYLGTFRWDTQKFPVWNDLPLDSDRNAWSGAVAADILTRDLIPDTFTLYTSENLQQLMKICRLIPDKQGDLKVYQKFWSFDFDTVNHRIAPLPVIYADLIDSGSARYLEKAKTIYEEHFINKL